MKLVFNELNAAKSVINVSFDGGKTWIDYSVDQLRKNPEIYFSEEQCSDLTKIKIKGLFKTYSDIDAVYNPATIVTVAKPEGGVSVTNDAIVAYVSDVVDGLTTERTALDGGYIFSVKESKGIVTSTVKLFDTEITSNSTDTNAPTSKAVYNLMQSLGNIYKIKPSVNSYVELPQEGNSDGDVRLCNDSNTNYVWYSNSWNKLGGTDVVSALDYHGATTKGEAIEFITQVTQDDGLIHATKAAVPEASSTVSGIVRLSDSTTSESSTIAATSSAVRSVNEKLLNEIETRKDANADLKVTFNTEIQKLSDELKDIKESRDLETRSLLNGVSANLNSTTPSKRRTLSAFDQKNGRVSAYFTEISIGMDQVEGLADRFDEEAHNRNVAIQRAISDLDCDKTGSDGSYIKYIKEVDGIIQPEKQAFDTELNLTSTHTNAPTSKAVFDIVNAESLARSEADRIEAEARNTSITNAINALDVETLGAAGSYIEAISETDGKISATAKQLDTTVTKDSTNLVAPTSKAVYDIVNKESTLCQGLVTAEVTNRDNAITSAIGNLDVSSVGGSGKYISAISEEGGIISPISKDLDQVVNSNSTHTSAPTTKAVYDAILIEATARKNAIDSLGNVYNVKGSVTSYEALPKENNKIGDVYNCNDTGDNYVWTADGWDKLGGTSIINTLNYNDPAVSTGGTTVNVISGITQSNGQIAAVKMPITSASTSTKGIVKLNNTTESTSTTEAATANVTHEIKLLLDDLESRIEKLELNGSNSGASHEDILKINDRLDILDGYEIIKFENLSTYLSEAEANTAETPYKIKVTKIPASGIGSSYASNTLGYLLRNNSTKYVSLKFDDSLDNVTTASGMFRDCTGLTEIDTSAFTEVTNAENMFNGCTGLTEIDTSAFTEVTNAENMFYGCTGLTSIDTSGFTKVTNARSMFYDCTGLTEIDTSAFTEVTNASWMFYNCTGLTSIDTSAFTSVTYAVGMFSGCTGLTEIDTKAFAKVTNAYGMFSDCALTAYYSSEEDNLYKNYKDDVYGRVIWSKK